MLAAAVAGDYVYAIGGLTVSTGTSSVERALINADGSLGSWQLTTSMTTPRNGLAAVAVGGYIYALGGHDGGSLSSVERALINADGSLGPWQLTTSMTTARHEFGAASSGGYIYAVGGAGGTAGMSSVERAATNPDGSSGTWQPVASMNSSRYALAGVVVGNYLYALGGRSYLENDLHSNRVERAEISPVSITSLSPAVIPAEKTSTITLAGANFLPIPTLQLGDAVTPAVRFVSTTMLTTTIPAGMAGGHYNATLTNADGRVVSLADALYVDGTTPTAEGLVINQGALNTASITVTLTVTVTDSADEPSGMSFSNDGTSWGDWRTYETSGIWELSSGHGMKTVYGRFRDAAGHVSQVVSDSISLTLATVQFSDNAYSVGEAANTPTLTVTLSGASDLPVTVDYATADGTATAGSDFTATSGTLAFAPGVSSQTFSVPIIYDPTDEPMETVTLTLSNPVGAALGTPVSATLMIVDSGPPTPGALTINDGALSSTATSVTLRLSVVDAIGVADMSFSNDGRSWGSWQSYSTSADWELSNGDGMKTVYGRFLDTAGNAPSVALDMILLDSAAGTDYGFTINDGALFTNQTGVTLKIGARQGTARMLVSNDGGFAGATWEPYDSRKAWQITQYGNYVIPRVVYVKYSDLDGAVSGAYQDDIVLDVNAPTGSVDAVPGVSGNGLDVPSVGTSTDPGDIKAAGLYSHTVYLPATLRCYPPLPTGPANVTLELSATDDVSGVADMMISNQADFFCESWETYATRKGWYVPEGTTTIYVKFRDNAGNVSDVATDTITR